MTLETPEFVLTLAPEAQVSRPDEDLRITLPWLDLRLPRQTTGVAAAVARMVEGGATENQLCADAQRLEGAAGLFAFYSLLHLLDGGGALCRRLGTLDRPFATLRPVAAGNRFQPNPFPESALVRLSRFAYLRAERGTLQVESPLGCARLELNDWRAAAAAAALANPRGLDELSAHSPDLPRETIAGLLVLLHNAGALQTAAEAVGSSAAPSEGWWEFHDLLFHMRSRRGRHHAPYGGTLRLEGVAPAPPLVRPAWEGPVTALEPAPDLARLRKTDRPFAEVLEQRRSIRDYGDEPLSVGQLGEFLYRSARIQKVLPGNGADYALRPSPSGGALQELEVYPVIARCRGLDPGVYHYCPSRHNLTLAAGPSPLLDRLLEQAWQTGGRGSPLNIYLVITARCGRVFWKYESMAYALILKDLGALYATMYLTATAMGLAPCALGGGDSELFSRVTGLDPYVEPAVGEFLLGNRGVP